MIKFVKVIATAAVITAAIITVSGCSRITVLRTKELKGVQDTLQMELTAALTAVAESLQNQLAETQKKLAEEQSKLLEEQKTIAEMLRLLRADQFMRFSEIDRKVSAIESNLAESHSRLSQLDRQTAEVSRRLGRALASEEEAANQRQLQLQQLFEIAMSDFNAGRYDLAISGFQDLVTQHPGSPLAIEAEFWTAESHFAKRDFETAEKQYFDFIRSHPNNPRICVTMFKLGLAYEKQEKNRSRDMVWNNLLERCPDGQEAQAVRAQKEKR